MRSNMEVEHALDMAEQERRCVVMPAHSLRCALLRRVGAGDVLSPARGLFVRREYWERLDAFERNRHMTRALNLQYPAWVFGGLEAACAHRIDHDISLHGNALKVIVTRRRTQSSSWIVREYRKECTAVVVDGVRVPSFACTVAEIMHDYGFVNAVIAASCALRRQVTKQQIAHELRQLGDCEPYVWRALEYASPLCANGGEARALAVMIEEGIQRPLLQHEFVDPDTGRRAYSDYLWILPDGRLIVGELDGREKYVNPEMTGGRTVEECVDDERRREHLLERCGVSSIVRFRVRDTYNPAVFKRKLLAAGVPLAQQ